MAGPIVAGAWHAVARGSPEIAYGLFLPDDHPRLAAHCGVGERFGVLAGGDDVRADVAETDDPAVLLERREAREAAARDVLEEDAFDRLLRTEGEHLVEGGRHRPHDRIISGGA